MTNPDNSIESIATKVLLRADVELSNWSYSPGQDLAFNLAAMSGILFNEMKADKEELATARTRIVALHRKIGELVEGQETPC